MLGGALLAATFPYPGLLRLATGLNHPIRGFQDSRPAPQPGQPRCRSLRLCADPQVPIASQFLVVRVSDKPHLTNRNGVNSNRPSVVRPHQGDAPILTSLDLSDPAIDSVVLACVPRFHNNPVHRERSHGAAWLCSWRHPRLSALTAQKMPSQSRILADALVVRPLGPLSAFPTAQLQGRLVADGSVSVGSVSLADAPVPGLWFLRFSRIAIS